MYASQLRSSHTTHYTPCIVRVRVRSVFQFQAKPSSSRTIRTGHVVHCIGLRACFAAYHAPDSPDPARGGALRVLPDLHRQQAARTAELAGHCRLLPKYCLAARRVPARLHVPHSAAQTLNCPTSETLQASSSQNITEQKRKQQRARRTAGNE